MAHPLLRRLAAAGGLLSLLTFGLPQAAFGADAPSTPKREITVTITDAGFDQQSYTVGYSSGTSSSGADSGVVNFVNKGTMVHNASAVPGTLDEGASRGKQTDALGNIVPCQLGASCSKTGKTDTGGIDPGGSVSLGFAPPDSTGVTYTLTSATDCLYGNSTPGFNCTPVTLKVVAIPATSPISGTFQGSVLRPAGSADCVTDIPAVVPDVGPAFCFSAVRDPGKVAGSPSKPLGDTTVTITDFGFEPALVYIKGGSTVTWVNKGTRLHSVFKKGPPYPPDGYHLLDSGGLAPGDSYSYTFVAKADCPIPSGCSSTNYQSFAAMDFVPQSMAGFAPPGGCSRGKVCGQPAMVGKISVVG